MLYQSLNPHGGDIYTDPVRLDFSANTNPFGTPQGVVDAVRKVLTDMHRYPDPYCRKLVKAISEFEAVPKEYILCGNGAAELIYSCCEALKPKRAAELAPTFSEYSLGLQRVDCRVERYILEQEQGFEPGADFPDFLREKQPEVLFLCNPNNPTGKTLEPALMMEILSVCREKNIFLFVDECFLDLTDEGESLSGFLGENPNLLILKAFTKSYGMAGVRLGYCMSANASLLERMSHTVQPWNVSSLAQAAGIAALKEQAFLEKTKNTVRVQRAWLKAELEELGFWVCPSKANFLLFQGPEYLHQELKKQGISIRSCSNYYGLGPGWFRIGVRLPEENRLLIDAITRIGERM